jgi:hypothetical protein
MKKLSTLTFSLLIILSCSNKTTDNKESISEISKYQQKSQLQSKIGDTFDYKNNIIDSISSPIINISIRKDTTYIIDNKKHSFHLYEEIDTVLNDLNIRIKNINKETFSDVYKREIKESYINRNKKQIIFDSYDNVDNFKENFLNILDRDSTKWIIRNLSDTLIKYSLDRDQINFIAINSETEILFLERQEHEWEFFEVYSSRYGEKLLSIDASYAKIESPLGHLYFGFEDEFISVYLAKNGKLFELFRIKGVPVDRVCWNSDKEILINCRFKGYISIYVNPK